MSIKVLLKISFHETEIPLLRVMIRVYAFRDFQETVALIARGASLQLNISTKLQGLPYSSKHFFIIQAGLPFWFLLEWYKTHNYIHSQ